MRKRIFPLLLKSLTGFIILTASCQTNIPTTVTEETLPQVICQAEDFTTLRWGSDGGKSEAPQLEKLGEPIELGYQVRLLESSITYFVLDCEMAVYSDMETAQRAFAQACDPIQPADTLPEVGDESCTFRRDWSFAPNQWVFRRGPILVLLQGDTELHAPALAVDGRLENDN
jgi:hypothetical protein